MIIDINYLAGPIYVVPYRFSYQHLFLLLLSIVYILWLARFLNNKSFKMQRTILIILIVLSMLIFAGRMLFGWEGARIYNIGSKTSLLPLELCNFNIIITFIALLLNKKTLNNYLYYVSVLAAGLSLVIFPDCHMWPDKTLFHYMFFDYYFIHTQLVAIPIVMICCGWFKPDIKKVPLMMLLVLCYYTFVFGVSSFLRIFEVFKTANYMYVYDHANLPILKPLYNLVKLPFAYGLPILLFLPIIFIIMALPFNIKIRKV